MTATPFLTLKIRTKKDALLARLKARRVAGLLNYDVHEQACIAAGVFVIACQALTQFGKARLCFVRENQQLHVLAQAMQNETSEMAAGANRITELLRDREAKTLLRLAKPLPAPRSPCVDELDLGWLVNQVEATASNGMFEEIVKQNQEILSLLHELRLCGGKAPQKEEKMTSPHAA